MSYTVSVKRGLRLLNRGLSAILALSVLGTQCLFAYQPENNFWAERRRATRRTAPTLFASLPLDAASIRANSLTVQFPAPQKVGTILSPSVARSVPHAFSMDHAKILSALSPAHGTIRKVSLPKAPAAHGPVVIHIQDVHMNREAQWNIRETVKSLLQSGQVGLVALEGATEPIDLQVFVDYPHGKAVEMAADYLLKENKISGPIHAALTARGKLPRILGVDDPTHYEANIQAYRDSAPKLEKTRQEVRAIQKEIDVQKRIIYSPALQSFDRKVQQYREGKSSLGDYVLFLTTQVDPDRKGDTVGDFLSALRTERTLDFKQVESERTRLIERLTQTLTAEETKRLVAQSFDYRAGRLRYGDFYTALSALCEKKGIHLKSYPALDSYVKYVLLADGIDAEQLMTEISTLEKRAYARQIMTPEEQSLTARSRQAWLTGKLVEFALTPTEWEEYSAGPRPLTQEGIRSFENFYKEADARDMAMAQNLLQAMKEASPRAKTEEGKVTLLVTGGFHAEGMTQQLTRQGVTVLSYLPKIEKVDTAQGSTYLSVFTQEKSPLEKLFSGDKLFLAHNPIARVDQKIEAPLLVASATLFLGLLTAGFDFSSAYHLVEGIGTFSSLELGKMMVEGVIGTSAAAVAFTVATSPSGGMSVKTGAVRSKGTHFWNVLRDATTEEIFGNLRKVSVLGFLKGRLPSVILGAGMGLSGPFSTMFGGLFLLWFFRGIPLQYQFVLDHANRTSQQIHVRSVGTFLLNSIAFSLPLFGDFTLLSNAFLVGTTGAIGAHTLWNILAESGRKAGLWEQDYRLGLILADTLSFEGFCVTREQGVFGTLSNEALVEILGTYSERIKKIAPHIWFVRTGGTGADLSRDRQHLTFHVPPEISLNQVRNYMDDALGELESYLIQPHAGLIYLVPLSQNTGEFDYIQDRLERIHEEATFGGQELMVLVERSSFLAEEIARFSFLTDPAYFQEIMFGNQEKWKETFQRMKQSMEAMTQSVEQAIEAGALLTNELERMTLLGWLNSHRVKTNFEEVESHSQRLFLQGLWFLSVPFVWAPWPVKNSPGNLEPNDITSFEKRQLREALAFAKSELLREARLAERLASLPISPRRAYAVIYGPEHLFTFPSVPGLTILPARGEGQYSRDLEIVQAMTPTLYDQLIVKCREKLEELYFSPQASNGQRRFLSDTLEKEAEEWGLLIQKTFLFMRFVHWGQGRLDADGTLRLSRLVEKLTDSMTTESLRQWTTDLLNQDPAQWERLWVLAEQISPQDRNFLKTTLREIQSPGSITDALARNKFSKDPNSYRLYTKFHVPLWETIFQIPGLPKQVLQPLSNMFARFFFGKGILARGENVVATVPFQNTATYLGTASLVLGAYTGGVGLIVGGMVWALASAYVFSGSHKTKTIQQKSVLFGLGFVLAWVFMGPSLFLFGWGDSTMTWPVKIFAYGFSVLAGFGLDAGLHSAFNHLALKRGWSPANVAEGQTQKSFNDLAKEGRVLVDQGKLSEASVKFKEAVSKFNVSREWMGYSGPLGAEISLWINGTQTGDVFEEEAARLTSMETVSAESANLLLLASLYLSSGYFIKAGPQMFVGQEKKEGTEIPFPSLSELKRIGPLQENLLLATASNPILYETLDGKKKYVVKNIGRGAFTDSLSLKVFHLLGFSVADTRPVAEDAGWVMTPWIDETVTAAAYIRGRLSHPNYFREEAITGKLFPPIFRDVLEGSKVASMIVELTDFNLGNVLLRVNTEGDLLPDPPIFFDFERSFYFATSYFEGPTVVQKPYRGKFFQTNFFSRRETNRSFLEPLFHRNAQVESMGWLFDRLKKVTKVEINKIVEDTLVEFWPQYVFRPLHTTRDELEDSLWSAVQSAVELEKLNVGASRAPTILEKHEGRPSYQKNSPATLSRFWSLFSASGPLDHILRLAKWESAPSRVAMGLAVGAHFLLGASLGWAFGVAILAGALGGAHWFGTYAVVGGKLQEVRGQNSVGKALSWFLWTSAFGVSLYLLGSVLPQDIVAFGIFLATWIGTYLGVKEHGRSNRGWVVNNIPNLTDTQRVIAREILKNLEGRPITLDMNQMRELVVLTAENIANRRDSGAIDLSAPIAPSSSGINFMFVSQASLATKGLENLRTIMARNENVFVLSDALVPGIPVDRMVVVPFGALPESQRGNLPFLEVLLTEVRSRIDALAPDHPLRRRSSDLVTLFHTPDLQLWGEGLDPDDPLAQAAKNPMVLLLESFRAFPFFNQAWQDSLKALRALAEFA